MAPVIPLPLWRGFVLLFGFHGVPGVLRPRNQVNSERAVGVLAGG